MFLLRGSKNFTTKYFKNVNRLFSSDRSDYVKVVEVGPRDGLQNESKIISTDIKVELINKLSQCGFSTVETTSFVSPKWVPQMADCRDVFKEIDKVDGVSYPVLVPNLQGLESALNVGVKEIAIFASASETFSQKNVNCSIEKSFKKFDEVCEIARDLGIKIRGYVSCVVGCPYEGPIKPALVAKSVIGLLNLGCYEVSLGDTIGVGTAGSIKRMIREVRHVTELEYLALHCHDTLGQGLANVLAGLEMGLTTMDSSVSGLGGCPYARGASGNVATEDLVYMLHGLGAKTDINIAKLIDVGRFICGHLGKLPNSKVNLALGDKYKTHNEIMEIAYCYTPSLRL